jgi:hypothetical protein
MEVIHGYGYMMNVFLTDMSTFAEMNQANMEVS